MTPIGSFQGSKRETWVRSGRSTSIPNCSQTNEASSGESAMFFGESGSIAGGISLTSPFADCSSPSGTYSRRCQTLASYSSTSGLIRLSVVSFGVERSMWQRQIHFFAASGALWRRPTGCGSWTMITSQASSARLWAFIQL
jgi:hypothetical protein